MDRAQGGSCLAFEDDRYARMRVTCVGWQEIKLAGWQGLDCENLVRHCEDLGIILGDVGAAGEF